MRDSGRLGEVVILLLAFIAANVAGACFQHQLSINDGKGWEGVSYYQVAGEFARHAPIAAAAPFVYRIGTPWLAALVSPGNLFHGFRVVNLAANSISLGLLIAWLRRFIASWRVRTVLGLLFICQWDAPVRWLWFYPAHTDPWLWVFLLGGMLLVDRARTTPTRLRMFLLAVFCPIGVLFRDVALAPALAVLLIGNPLPRDLNLLRWARPIATALETMPARTFLPLGTALATTVALHRMVTQTDAYSFLWTVVHWLYEKPWPTYFHGWMLAFGPVLFVLIYDWRRAADFLMARQDLLAYLAIFALLGYIGGTDTERLLYWSMPAMYVLLGRAMEAHGAALLRSPMLLALLAGGQILSSRMLWTIPNYPAEIPRHWPLLTPLGSDVPLLDLFSFHGERPVELISLLEYVFLGAVVLLGMHLAERRRAASTAPALPAAIGA